MTLENAPMVSAVISTYQRCELAKHAVRSALAQTYDPLEIIVVEDGSSSGIEKWIQAKDFDRVRYIRHDENRGLAATRNTGYEAAEGGFVAYLDDDDEWRPERVQRQMNRLFDLPADRREQTGVVYCGFEKLTQDGIQIEVLSPVNEGHLATSIRRDGIVTLSSTFLFDKEALVDVDGFDESLPSSIDHDIWMALATNGYHAYYVDEPLVISYQRPRDRMVLNTDSRIEGVRMFVEKWKSTHCEWYGTHEGIAFGQRYFAKVLARLATTKLVDDRNPRKAVDTIMAIFSYSDETAFNVLVISRGVMWEMAKTVLPRFVTQWIKQIYLELFK